jgi:predicted ArsR family transcriptional regulator
VSERPRVPDRTIELTDPRAMRAFAHPVRMQILGLLRRDGPLTASQAGARLGESSGSCSFHLRQLAKYGLVEDAGGGRGRERPWRATAATTSWGTSADPEHQAAGRHLDAAAIQVYLQRIRRWMESRYADPPEWRHAAGYGDALVPLTAAELERLRSDVAALVELYRGRVTGDEEPPEGARPVALIHFEFPEEL